MTETNQTGMHMGPIFSRPFPCYVCFVRKDSPVTEKMEHLLSNIFTSARNA